MYDTVLVPTDGGQGMEPVIEHAVSIGDCFGATVQGLFVADERVWEDVPVEAEDKVKETIEEKGANATDRIATAAENAGVPVNGHILDGVPHQAILTYTSENPIDMIVMGTHGQTGPGSQAVGSVAERVVRRSPVPVHVVPITGDALPQRPESAFM